MKKSLLLGLALTPAMMMAQITQFSDNFDTYSVGTGVAAQSGGTWVTWSGGATDDAPASATQASSPSNSMNVYNNGAGNYLHDMVLPFPSCYLTGEYEYKMKMYIPSGSAGYFNLGSKWLTGGTNYEWGLDAFFNADGSGYINAAGTGVFTYSQDTWFEVSVRVDIDALTAVVTVGGTGVGTFPWNATQGFGVVDIFALGYSDGTGATEVTSDFYVDDVEIIDWNSIVGLEDQELNTSLSVYPNPTNAAFSIALENNQLTNYTLTITDITGNTILTEALQVDGSYMAEYDLSLAAGVYFVNVSDGTNRKQQKLVIQ